MIRASGEGRHSVGRPIGNPPALAMILVRISLREVSRDAGEADRNPKLLEFSPDLSGASALLGCESPNERLHLS